jgi:uncharacterized protein
LLDARGGNLTRVALPAPSLDSTCLVTGASSGIGAEIARELARRGHNLTLAARREDRLRELADELADTHGVRVEVEACDVADAAARERLVAALDERRRRVDVLVNNAGFGTGGRFTELDGERELEMVRTNVEAVTAFCTVFVPRMSERGMGAVLNVASLAGFAPMPRQATYAATKAFVLSFSEALHEELAGSGVTVTCLCPGPVKSEFAEVAGFREVEESTPDVFWMSTEDTARAGVRGLEKGRRVVTPGPMVTVTSQLERHTPHSLLLPLMNRAWPVGK